MSGTWADHIARVNAFISADKEAKSRRRADRALATSTPSLGSPLTVGSDSNGAPIASGGAQGGLDMPQGGVGNVDMLGGNGISPQMIGGLLGGLGGGLLGGPFGGLAGALGGRFIGGLLAGPTTPPAVEQPVAPGVMGGNDGAFGGGAGVGTFGGGLGDIGTAGMGLGVGGLGAMSGNEIMGFGGMPGFQKGGYTGAGHDGVVQPHRPAGIVHEGEYVIPAHVVRRMMGRGMLG